MTFKVDFGPYAADYVRSLKAEAFDLAGNEKTGSRELTAYLSLKHVAEELIPAHALNPIFALGNKNNMNFAGIYRAKRGRLRVLWIASKDQQKATVLFIGNRKRGDRKDAYSDFHRRLIRGDFSAEYRKLGISR